MVRKMKVLGYIEWITRYAQIYILFLILPPQIICWTQTGFLFDVLQNLLKKVYESASKWAVGETLKTTEGDAAAHLKGRRIMCDSQD